MATKPSVVKRFKDSHHMLARMFASGMRPGEVCLAAGYSNSRVSVFLADPAFQELIAQYREAVDHTWRQGIDNYHTLATANMLVAERMLSDRLEAAEDEGVLPSVRELVMISADRADRFGFAKRTTQVNLNLDFAAQLDRAIARSGVTIEGRAISGAAGSTPALGPPAGASALDVAATRLSGPAERLGASQMVVSGEGEAGVVTRNSADTGRARAHEHARPHAPRKLVETSTSLHSPRAPQPWPQPAPLPSPVVEAPRPASPAPVDSVAQTQSTGAVLAFKRRF